MGNTTYLLPGRVPALVDAGVGGAEHLDAVAAALDGAPLVCVLVTHSHRDHVAGLPAISGRWPSVRVVRFIEGIEGEPIAAGDGLLRAIHTPGHSPDHLCFLDESSGDLYCGDLVREGGTIVIPASRGGNLRQYLDSLRRVRDLSPRRLLPGHGPIIDDPAVAIGRYLQHRAEREAQIIGALRDGLTSPESIAARVYGELPAETAGAAVDTVRANLVKLMEEWKTEG